MKRDRGKQVNDAHESNKSLCGIIETRASLGFTEHSQMFCNSKLEVLSYLQMILGEKEG